MIHYLSAGAPIASVGCYLAPIPTIKDVVHTGTVGSLPMLPYSAMASNAFMWCTYGIMKHQASIWSCNGIGFVLAMYYMFQFAQYVPNKRTKESTVAAMLDASTPTLPGTVRQHVMGVAAVIAGTTLLALIQPFATRTANVIGNIAVLFCILMFASPLSVIQVVLRTKSAKSIPLPFTIVSSLNCFLWVVFGWFKLQDVNVWLPNSLGLTFGMIQVILKLVFGDHHDGSSSLPTTNYSPVNLAP